MLPDNEVRALLADVQDVPVVCAVGDDGEVTTTYGRTEASEAALTKLLDAFAGAIRRAAMKRTTLEAEDAESIARLSFIQAVRRYDLQSQRPFYFDIRTILDRELSVAARTSGTVAVKESVGARYHRLMHEHDLDVAKAYANCRAYAVAPLTFLAAHNALAPMRSMSAPSVATVLARDGFEESVVDAELVQSLLELVTDRQRLILRLHCGFGDDDTRQRLVGTPYQPGSNLTIVETAEVLAMARSTAQRERSKALATMATALQTTV